MVKAIGFLAQMIFVVVCMTPALVFSALVVVPYVYVWNNFGGLPTVSVILGLGLATTLLMFNSYRQEASTLAREGMQVKLFLLNLLLFCAQWLFYLGTVSLLLQAVPFERVYSLAVVFGFLCAVGLTASQIYEAVLKDYMERLPQREAALKQSL
jgi:hypothetical protein